MALSDPQSITIGGIANSLPRVNSGNNSSTYQDSTGLLRLTASHAYGRRTRRVLRLDNDKVVADPINPSVNVKTSMSNYIVFDVPTLGWSNAEVLEVWQGLRDFASASSDSIITKLLGGEN